MLAILKEAIWKTGKQSKQSQRSTREPVKDRKMMQVIAKSIF